MIHSSWLPVGCRSADSWGTASRSTCAFMATTRQGRVSTARPAHSQAPAGSRSDTGDLTSLVLGMGAILDLHSHLSRRYGGVMKVEASSGRAHVPAAALLLIDLVNSAEPQEGTDTWDSPDGLRTWLLRHDLLAPADRVTAADLHRLLDLREGLRAVLAAHAPAPVDADPGEPADSVDPAAVARLNAALGEVPLRVRFGDDGAYRLASRAAAGVNGAVGRVLDAVRSASEDGSWTR